MNESLSINKNINSGSRNLPQYSLYWGCLLHGKSTAVPPWPNRTHGHSVRQNPFRGLWSVLIVNLLPARNSLKHLIPHTSARVQLSFILLQ